MARTIQEIKNELTQNFVDNSTIQNLYGLTAGVDFDTQFSKVSFEGIFFYIIALSIWTLEKLFDEHKLWIENKAKEIKVANTDWYRNLALNFQFGDTIVFEDGTWKYPTINEANKIVKLASVTDEGNYVLIKVASLDNAGNIIPLNNVHASALTSFNNYIKKMKIAGVKVLSVSRPADELKLYMHIYVDPLVIDATGKLISDGVTKPIEETINNYIKNLPFNGKFNATELVDFLQKTTGVINPVFDNASAKFGTQAYAPIVDYYNPNAGYLEIDPSFPLSTTITYILG
jgi:hypothetical protein